MGERIRVLIVEDRQADAELMLHELRRAGLEPEWQRVETEPDFLAGLDPPPDLILADNQLPQFDALTALNCLRERGQDVPFLIVSGTMGEDVAVAAMRQGASDYLLKDRLARLGPAVRQALQQKRLRHEALVALAALRESEACFRQLADAIPQIVWSATPDGRFDYYNRRWYDLTGLQDDQPGEGWSLLLHPEDLEHSVNCWRHAIRSGQGYQTEYRLRDLQGGYRWYLERAVPVRDESGAVIRWLGTGTDIDDRKRAEEALKEAAQRKDGFLAMLGHELRNPLGPIRNAVHVLRSTDPTATAARRARDIIDRQATHLARLVDDLLDVAKVSRGALRLQKRRLDLTRLVRDAVEDHRALLEGKDLALSVELLDSPLWVVGDPTRLSQVVGNLLQNAHRFSDPRGRVKVALAAKPADGTAVLTVQDTGVGMSPALLGRLFEAFSQTDPGLEHGRGGLGLGLALVKGLVELHGGTVGAYSEGPGKGSRFTVRLPLPQHDAALPALTSRPHFGEPSLGILVIEDRPDAAESLQMVLEARGYRVEVAHTGPAGVEAGRRFRPDVVLCDIGLADEMDGYGVAQAFRRDPDLAAAYLIALTGYGQEVDRRRAREAGFDLHLTKPVDPEALGQLLANLPLGRAEDRPLQGAGDVCIEKDSG
ncbi:MAG TPA: response regulator [Gemmataceae bacterium]|nr:response regulator [Gemmataceae bacterium]